jgi:hypothetical protein
LGRTEERLRTPALTGPVERDMQRLEESLRDRLDVIGRDLERILDFVGSICDDEQEYANWRAAVERAKSDIEPALREDGELGHAHQERLAACETLAAFFDKMFANARTVFVRWVLERKEKLLPKPPSESADAEVYRAALSTLGHEEKSAPLSLVRLLSLSASRPAK